MRALKRLIPGRPAAAVGGGDERVAAASAALRGLAAAQGGSDQLGHAARMLVAIPAGAAREALIQGEFRKLLLAAISPAAEETILLLDRQLALLAEAFDSKELANAVAGAIVALTRDARVERHVAAAPSLPSRCVEAASDEEAAAARCKNLAAACQGASCLAEAVARCEDAQKLRCQALQQAEKVLSLPKHAAEQRSAAALARKGQLEEELAAKVAASGEAQQQEGNARAAQEEELLKLQERQRELRRELDAVSLKLTECREQQRAHMTQVDAQRANLQAQKSGAASSKREVAAEMDRSEGRCKVLKEFTRAVQELRVGLHDVILDADAEGDALAERAANEESAAAASLSSAAGVQLAAAAEEVRRLKAEDERARRNMELMDVSVTEAELPTQAPLLRAVAALRNIWAEQQLSLCVDVEASRREEVEQLLLALPSIEGTGGAVAHAGAAMSSSLGDSASAPVVQFSDWEAAAANEDGTPDSFWGRSRPMAIGVDLGLADTPLVSPAASPAAGSTAQSACTDLTEGQINQLS